MSEAFANRYQLQSRIAVGGTAEVFRALYVGADGEERKVVIKRILPQFARDERFRRLFHEEACVAATMSHPSIVRVLDHGDLGPTCYIALELVEGKDLGSLLAASARSDQPPSPRLSAYVTAQVAEALEFIHAQTSSEGTPLRIIHRDVSPQNILVSYTGDVKLTDFGIAKSAIRREQTVDGTLRGKLDYMSPEQARVGPVDHRADIFALGCVLYEMLHGSPPFRGEHELDTLERVRAGRFAVPPEELLVPVPLRGVLARALCADPAARYQRAAEMAVELRRYLDEVGTPSPENLGRWLREVESAPAAGAQDRVDEAVRRLLGGGEETGDPASAPDAGTAVFASASAVEPREAPLPPTSRRWQVALLAGLFVAALAGWLVWALSPPRGPGRAPIGASLRHDGRGAIPRADRRASPDDRGGPPAADDRGPAPLPGLAARLELRSHPAGASVLLDGELRGRTPLRLTLPEAPFQLELQKEGHRSWRRRLVPASLGAVLEVTLPVLAGGGGQATLTINTLPWSRVLLDGKPVGDTPLVRLGVKAGNHRLELLAPDGTLRRALSISLEPGVHRTFTFDLTR